jgi:hypothetical protein
MTVALIDEMMNRITDRWQDCKGTPESTLLRLCLLKELLQSLHSEKSRCLAAGQKDQAQAIKVVEVKLESLRESAALQPDLSELLNHADPGQRKKRIIPEALFKSLDREKLLRYDRQWEAAITAEAASLSWKFWSLDSWVSISALEEWDKTLHQKLWPHGLILFVESYYSNSRQIEENHSESNLWRGRWIVALHSRFQSPLDLSLDLRYWQGFPEKAPSEPQWKKLYP